MDRRSRSSASMSRASSKRLAPRVLRRPLALFRRASSSRDLQYALVSIVLLTLATTIIFRISMRPRSSTVYPFISVHREEQESHTSEGHGIAASGTMRELDELLQHVANSTFDTLHETRALRRGLVVAIAVNYAFRRLALNFVCNLKRLRVNNYVVLAMDHAVYEFLSKRNANVFFYNTNLQKRRRILSEEDVFGSSAFLETSRRKSILVLKALRLGYSVLFSDVDVIWVRNPIPEIMQHEQDFVMQSDRHHRDNDAALNYNLNSGFYLVRSSLRAVTALQAIVRYAQAVRRSEQKAFNYVLCGAFKDHHAGPGLRIGSSECTYHKDGGATAKALSLDAFPNGSYERLWNNSTAPFEKVFPEVIAVHANYVEGRAEKVERIKKTGFWFHSEESDRADECVLPPR